MTKAVMVRCYLLCLLTLALCCACGLVWADSPKASDALTKTSTVGVPSLVRRAISAEDVGEQGSWIVYDEDVAESPPCDNSDSHGCRTTIDPHRSGGEDLKQKKVENEEEVKRRQEPDQADSELEISQASHLVKQHRGANLSKPLGATGVKVPEVSLGSSESSPDERAKQLSSRSSDAPEEPTKLVSELSTETNTDNTLNSGRVEPGSVIESGQVDESSGGSSGGSSGSSSSSAVSHPSPPTHNNPTPGGPEPAIPTPASPADGSSVAAADGQTGNSGNNITGETAANQRNKATQPSSSSSNKPDTGNAGESETTLTENGTASTERESTNNQEGVESNTDNTTTLTTLPPELTNSKKGDGDSSSSISSSVWVRVPLLIVVTLSCILLC
ncbi:uncharacterized protein TM35_001501020 [Trypanosoma theileri]|uniref:Mucin-associated surface protein (MASP) n=1 Tax=Trypanosoma theileri TaxID=67003 RepID=A0A1X0NDA0_9TRYP|nr:uncharacterized protein TM35_001501020 [Trypanosoma theileri]ORC80672.1 hypothetical protein TM35_001501020 [Trypanosoma theileri]